MTAHQKHIRNEKEAIIKYLFSIKEKVKESVIKDEK